jgi:hypothetical protein
MPLTKTTPQFTPPRGWTLIHYIDMFGMPAFPFTWRGWTDGKLNYIDVVWKPGAQSLAQLRDNYPHDERVPEVTWTLSEYAKVCNGTQDALHLVHQPTNPGPYLDERDVVHDGVRYFVRYSSMNGNAPDDAAKASLDSFCAP